MRVLCKVLRELKEQGTGADFPYAYLWKCKDCAIGANPSSILLYRLTADEEARFSGSAVGKFVELNIDDIRRPSCGPIRAKGAITHFDCKHEPTRWPVHTEPELFKSEITRKPPVTYTPRAVSGK